MTQNDWNCLNVGSLVASGPVGDQAFGVVTHVQVSPLTRAVDWMFVRWTKWTDMGRELQNCEVQNNFWDFVGKNVEIVQQPEEGA